AHLSVDLGERAGNQHLAVRLQTNADHDIVRLRSEAAIEAAIRVETYEFPAHLPANLIEEPADQQLAVRLHHDRHDVAVFIRAAGMRIKGAIEAAIRVQSSDTVAGLSVDLDEFAADEYLAIRLECQAEHDPGRVRMESGIDAALRGEARKMVVGLS